MDSATAAIVWIVIAKVFTLGALWLRLHWRERREQQRQRYLLQVAGTVVPDGQVELDDQDSDGHRLHLKITRTPVPGEDQTA
ncbi:hypothetical protein [Streptomyces sp. NPDC059215]|uniref:hypothetical protein n=1 Tax=Streptomyces sp. NPDC059215 TaxID=3346772 RepID=UPI0036851560